MKIVLEFRHFRKPLQTLHHDPRFARPGYRASPRTGWRFDWHCVRANPHLKDRAALWHLWLYTRDAAGEPLGRLICFGWLRTVKR